MARASGERAISPVWGLGLEGGSTSFSVALWLLWLVCVRSAVRGAASFSFLVFTSFHDPRFYRDRFFSRAGHERLIQWDVRRGWCVFPQPADLAPLGFGLQNGFWQRGLWSVSVRKDCLQAEWFLFVVWVGWSGSNEAPPSALLHERQFNLVRYSQTKTGTGYIPAHTISIRETAGKGSYFTSTERRSLLDVARDGAKQLEQRSGFHLLGDIGATEQLMGRRHRAPGRPSCEQVVSNTSGASKGRGAGRWAA